MAGDPTPLAVFLRARRDLVTPELAGLDVIGPRRLPGLRREEVAMVAGIRADYSLRLEQGRDRNPPVQVLEAIARVLRLDDDTLDHLLGLTADTARPARRRPRREICPSGTAGLAATLPLPAFVEGRYLDVLAANVHATALSPRLTPGRNRVRDVFLGPAEQQLLNNAAPARPSTRDDDNLTSRSTSSGRSDSSRRSLSSALADAVEADRGVATVG